MNFERLESPFIDPKKLRLIHLYQSLNQPQVSIDSDQAPEPALAHFIMAEAGEEQLYLFIGLFFLNSDERVVFQDGPFSPEDSPEKLAEAEAFAGEMGFMMDDLYFSSASEPERAELQRKVPFFYKNLQAYLDSLSATEQEVKATTTQLSLDKDTTAQKYSYFLEQYVTMLSML